MPKTYCTYRIKVANQERVQVEKWNSLHQPLGEPSGAFRYLAKLDELSPLLSSALNNELNDSNRVRTLGETLFDILFDDVLRQDFVNFYEQVVHRDRQLLRLELVIDEQGMPEVAALPWEFLCSPERANLGTIWLGTAPEVVFSRRRLQYFAAEPIQLRKNEKLRIALVVASPPGLPVVAYEPIQEALEKLAQEKAELVELLPVLHSAGLESIDEMLSQNPHIVHFIGHCGLQDEQGKEIGVIALVDPDENQVLWVEAGNFSELLNQHRPGLVMLQASQSGRLSASQAFVGVASRVVQQNIPVVVAMQYDVSDTIASRFARRFYKQLAEGDPVDIAAQYGRRAISLSPAQYKTRDFATPIIFMRVEDGYLFQTYKEEPPAPSSSVEMRRRLEAAMPQKSQVDRPTEVRVMVALHDSPGLRATLPDVTESGDLIQKNDAVQNDVALEFPVDSKTREPLPINIFVSITAPGFKIEQPAKSIRVSPKYDSGIITFFLTPTISQKYGRVVVEWFSDEQKSTLLGSLTLITEILTSSSLPTITSWEVERFSVSLDDGSIQKSFKIDRKIERLQSDTGYFLTDFFIILADKLEPELLPIAVEVAQAIQNENARIEALVALADRLPEMLPKVLEAAQTIQQERSRTQALIALADKLPPEMLPKALEVAQAIQDEYYRCLALTALAGKPPNVLLSVLEDSLEAVLTIPTVQMIGMGGDIMTKNEKDEYYHAQQALLVLYKKLPPESLLYALRVAPAIQDEHYRAQVLIILAHKLPDILPQIIKAALLIRDDLSRFNVLTALVDKLPDVLPNALEAAQAIQDARYRALALTALVDKLPDVLPNALEAAQAIQDARYRALALTALVDKLPDVLPNALEAAQDIQDQWFRARALVALVDKSSGRWTAYDALKAIQTCVLGVSGF